MIKLSLKYISLALFFLLAQIAIGQLYNFKTYSTKHGLANSNINAIYQGSQGYIWFCTQGGGISRFDGKEFKNYTKNDGLIANDVTAICEDKENNLWIGTTEGLSKYDGKFFSNYSAKDGIGNSVVYSIIQARNGDLWIATLHEGVKILRNNKFISIDTSNGLPTNSAFCVYEDSKGNFWIGLFKEGFCKVDKNGKLLEHIKSFSSEKKHYSAFSIAEDKEGKLWIGSITTGIYVYENGKMSLLNFPQLNKDLIGKIIFDKRQNAWIATEHGLLKISKDHAKLYTEKDGLSSSLVQTVCEDYEGNIWLGTFGGGACMLKDESLVTYTEKDGLSNNKVYCLLNTSKGLLLTGSYTGMDIYNGKTFKKTDNIPELKNTAILTFLEDSKQRIWVGTETKGIFVFQQKANELKLLNKYQEINKEPILQINKIVEDNQNNIWIASYINGVVKIGNDNTIEQFGLKNKLNTNDIITAYADKTGNVWFGTYNNGVYLFNGKNFIEFHKNEIPALSKVLSITGDEKANIFFGTQDGGLIIWNNKSFFTLNTKSGICSNLINAVEYQNGILWLGTYNGVNKITFNKNYEPKSIRYYGIDKGFKSTEINQNSIFAENNGTVWFGTGEGLTKYNPVFDYPNSEPPKLVLNDIRIFYEHVDWKKFNTKIDRATDLPINPILSYKQNHITFSFQATTTDKVMYTFLLDGDDAAEWSPLSTKNEAVFTNLAPGSYVFKVKVQNSNAVQSDHLVEFPFVITPPFWKTWWFSTLAILFCLLGIISFTRIRTANLKKEKSVLEHKVLERTIELEDTNHRLFDALHDIKDSINYAELIQRAMLPAEEHIQSHLPQSFIFFKPRDIVSGDFYWFSHKNGVDYITAVDCTGHGVPGAFMSMVGSSLLNEIILTKNSTNPSDILSDLNKGVQESLKQRENQTRDGMDIAFCAINFTTRQIKFAGANRALWVVRGNSDVKEVEEIKATKSSIGGFTEASQQYETTEISLNKGDTIYMSTDGYADQFGGEKGKKLMSKRFKEILLSINHQTMNEQRRLLEEEMNDWMSFKYEQVDDMLIIGVRF